MNGGGASFKRINIRLEISLRSRNVRSFIFTIVFIDPQFPVRRGNFGDSAIIRVILHIVQCAFAKLPYFYFRFEIWHHRRVPPLQFRTWRGDSSDWRTFKADIGIYLCLRGFRNLSAQNGGFEGKIGEEMDSGRTMLTPNELVLTFGGCYLCAAFGENRSRSADRQTNRQTDTHTHTHSHWIYILSHAKCSSYGADNNWQNFTKFCSTVTLPVMSEIPLKFLIMSHCQTCSTVWNIFTILSPLLHATIIYFFRISLHTVGTFYTWGGLIYNLRCAISSQLENAQRATFLCGPGFVWICQLERLPFFSLMIETELNRCNKIFVANCDICSDVRISNLFLHRLLLPAKCGLNQQLTSCALSRPVLRQIAVPFISRQIWISVTSFSAVTSFHQVAIVRSTNRRCADRCHRQCSIVMSLGRSPYDLLDNHVVSIVVDKRGQSADDWICSVRQTTYPRSGGATWSCGLWLAWHPTVILHCKTPFTRYNRLNVCLRDAAGCSTAVVKPHKRLNNRLDN